jgi:hypothetical protein
VSKDFRHEKYFAIFLDLLHPTIKTPTSIPTTNPMKLPAKLAIASLAIVTAASSASAQNATTDPVGFVTVNITAGTGTTKRNTFYSPPLLEAASITGQASGIITAVSSNSITNSNAGWTAGELSNPATPYLIMITSGAADGRIFLISSSAATGGAISGAANTATTVTVSSIDTTQVTNLTSLGIVTGTDTYKILSCDTLSSLFGTPASSGILGGTSVSNADVVTMVVNGQATNYFYKTDSVPPRWTRQSPATDASNVPILPYYGLSYARLAASPLSLTITGAVPTDPRQTGVKNSGNTIVSQFWPVDSTLLSSGISSVVTSGANATVADIVTLTSNGSATNYFYNGSEWRRQSPNTAANSTPIPVGTSVRISRKGSAPGYTTLSQAVPYNLQ